MTKKKLKLLYDASAICGILKRDARRSGLFFTAYNILLELLKRSEFDVELYCCGKDYRKIKYIAGNYPEFAGVKIRRVFRLSKIFDKFSDVDVYFSPMKAVPAEIRRKRHIKKYVVLHDVLPLINNLHKNAKYRWFNKLIKSVNKDDFYFANSRYTKNDFIKYVPAINQKNIFVIPLAAGKDYHRIEDETAINKVKEKYGIRGKYIFSLCNLGPRKNLIFAIKNFIKFIRKHDIKDFVFALGGSGQKEYHDIISKETADGNVIRLGYVDDDDLPALYSAAEMFLFPSLYEGFGIPVLEAMYCGCPVICSNVTSLPEVIGDCGIQIDPESDEQMTAALEKMYFDNKFRTKCIKKGLERAKNFTWKKCVDIIAEKICYN
ncbi:MAG: glycosyltransferase family 4 protein [Heliobacteriaceae bacterium]|jgi:glycosyltransferase involved in cell wall biosynthesis|nr:glycosyltransferase family 4 protein [Heliobacteriaceae bacterium]